MTMNKYKIGIIGGSGLDDPRIFKQSKEIEKVTPYGKTSDKLMMGKIAGKEVIILARHGKKHTIPPSLIPFRANVWALKSVGCTHILATTACGSLRNKFKPGDVVF